MFVQIKNSMLLLLTAIIWGVAFVAQSDGMNYVEPFTFNGVRSIIGAITLLPLVLVMGKREQTDRKAKENPRLLWIGGICCGIFLGVASALQQWGVLYTSVGKAGFITTFYIILVPLFGLFIGRRCGLFVWIGVIFALCGLYLLCITESFTVNRGDLLVFLCAICFSFQILAIDYFAPKVSAVKLSCIQFLVSGILNCIAMVLTESPDLHSLLAAWQPLLYAGVMSCGVAYTLQIVGQKGLNPTIAAMLMSLESVVSVLAGMLLLNQRLSGREVAGCVLMFIAIILAQLPQKHNS